MSEPPHSNGRGAVPLPEALDMRDPRQVAEDNALDDINARLAAGTLSPEDADAELLEITLERFAGLPVEILEEMRDAGRAFNREPEMVETRALAPRPKDDDEP